MAIPIAYGGRGALLSYLVGGGYVSLAQLRQFESGGSKQTLIDQTNTRSPDSFVHPLPVQVDSGEIDFSGALNPEDPTYLALSEFHNGMTLVTWQVTLPDGSSASFQAYVSEFKPFGVAWNKLLDFSGKLRLAGGLGGFAVGGEQFLGVAGSTILFAATVVATSPTPAFPMAGNVQLFQFTLTSDVSSSSLLTSGLVVPALIIFEITQDATGGRSFMWPANVLGGASPNAGANETTSQLFYFDGTNAVALTPGTVTP
jgi:hypothetical protein